MNTILVSILIVTELCIALVAFILQPDAASEKYWYSILWCSFLVLGNWIILKKFTTVVESQDGKNIKFNNAIYASIGIVIIIYTIFSVASLILYNLNFIQNQFHISIQIILFGFACVISLFMLISFNRQKLQLSSTITKSDILNSCRLLIQQSSTAEERFYINNIIDYVSNNLPHSNSKNEPNYQIVLEKINRCSAINKDNLEEILFTIKSLKF